MGLTRQWLETKPASTDKIKDGPAEFQARWKDLRELLNAHGVTCDSIASLTHQGKMAVDASGTGVNPTVFKADLVTKILEFADAAATLLSGYKLNGSKNIPEATVDDDVIGVDAKGYKRAVQALRIWESNPVDTKVNVKAGIYVKTGGKQVGYFAGAQLTIGTAPLTLPAAGNHAYYAIVINGSGSLTAIKGVEDVLANPVTAPDIRTEDNFVGVIEIKDTSVNFSLATSGANAFLVQDARSDTYTFGPGIVQVARGASGAAAVQQATIRLSKTITTSGGIVVAIARVIAGIAIDNFSLGRPGVPLNDVSVGQDEDSVLIGLEAVAAGTYTYSLRNSSGSAPNGAEIWLIELSKTAFV